MGKLLQALALTIALFAAPATAADFYTAGDSHGREIARLLGWNTVTVDGVSAQDLPRQLALAPFGAFVLVSIGTNDSARDDLVTTVPFYVQAALDVAEWRGQKLVFIGPSAVRRAGWNKRADTIDGYLETLLHAKGVPYISIFSDPAMQPADDGVHLRAVQYQALGAAGALQFHD
jgi:lysophospholipase L1-like esterase